MSAETHIAHTTAPADLREQLAAQAEAERTPEDRALFDKLAAAVRAHKARERAVIRAQAYRDAADDIDNGDDCGCGGCDSCSVRAAAAHLRDRADQIEGTSK
ncbi:hypothetical protein ACWENS_05515 [Streptomyces sp. NPDC004532]